MSKPERRPDRRGGRGWARLKSRVQRLVLGGYLCDHCKLHYGSACVRPERPNATVCEDFVRKGSR